MTGDPRVLAAELAERGDASLARLLAQRGVSAHAPWRDFFDAAEGLLDAASVDRVLTRMPRTALVALADAAAAGRPVSADRLGELVDLALVRADGVPFQVVSARVQDLARQHPAAFEQPPTTQPPAPADDADAAAAAERAALSAASLADLLLAGLHAPLARTGTGAVAATDRRRLLESGAAGSPEELDDLLETALAAGLAVTLEREWLVTESGARWLESTTGARWETVAAGIRASLPPAVRTAAGGFIPPAEWLDAYPLDSGWSARVLRLESLARRWGLFTASGDEPEWTATLRAGAPADASALVAHLPAEIDRVYLQADLSAIAPGPLAPRLDLRLRTMASRESRAQASTYRFTAATIASAVAGGETAESLRGFLGELSLTGIPQPLDYLIETTVARHGLVRVRWEARDGRTRVESDDPGILDTLAVDQSVRPIGLSRDGDGLVSRVARDAVYWTLVDARYPAVAVAPDGSPEPVARGRIAPAPVGGDSAHAKLIGTLRGSHGADADAAWLGRELDAAVRSRAVVTIVVTMPDGSSRDFTIEATGLGGGRLRGRDRGSDTERTLPVSSIVSVRPAP